VARQGIRAARQRAGDIGRLQREARIAKILPPEARHPGVLGWGTDGQIEWSLVRRVQGIDLSRAWPGLDARARERESRELAAALRVLHGVSAGDLRDDHALEPPHTLPLGAMRELFRRVRFAHPRAKERLLLLHVSRTLGLLVDYPDAHIRVDHLRSVLDGTCRVLG
jgi:hypothetical protein